MCVTYCFVDFVYASVQTIVTQIARGVLNLVCVVSMVSSAPVAV